MAFFYASPAGRAHRDAFAVLRELIAFLLAIEADGLDDLRQGRGRRRMTAAKLSKARQAALIS